MFGFWELEAFYPAQNGPMRHSSISPKFQDRGFYGDPILAKKCANIYIFGRYMNQYFDEHLGQTVFFTSPLEQAFKNQGPP